MRRPVRIALILTPLVGLAGVGAWFLGGDHTDPSTPPPAGTGRLVVLAVFGGLRGDVPDRWAGAFTKDGFARMTADGVWFADAHLPYAVTETGPGHASVATGLPPSVHGIVADEWFDRAAGKRVGCVTGAKSADRGPAPDRLLAPTVGDALRQTPGGHNRVFTVAGTYTAAVLLGGKQPDGCYWFDPAGGEFATAPHYRDRLPPWVEKANAAKPARRWVGTTWDRLGVAADYARLAGADDAPGEGDGVAGQGRTFPHPFARGDAGPRYFAAVANSPFVDELVWELAKAGVEAEGLGRGAGADLLCLGFPANDAVGRTWGPDSHEALDTAVRTDRLIAEMLKYLDGRFGKGGYTLVVTADHGMCPLPEAAVKDHPGAGRFDPRAELDPLPAVLDATFGKRDVAGGEWVERLDTPWVYLNRRYAETHKVPPRQVEEYAAQWAAGRDSSDAAFGRSALAEGLAPRPFGPPAQLSFHPARSGDVYAVRAEYTVPTGKGGTGTLAGSPHSYDTHVTLLAAGAGIPALKMRPERVNALSVAAIVARCLGIERMTPAPEPLPPAFSTPPAGRKP